MTRRGEASLAAMTRVPRYAALLVAGLLVLAPSVTAALAAAPGVQTQAEDDRTTGNETTANETAANETSANETAANETAADTEQLIDDETLAAIRSNVDELNATAGAIANGADAQQDRYALLAVQFESFDAALAAVANVTGRPQVPVQAPTEGGPRMPVPTGNATAGNGTISAAADGAVQQVTNVTTDAPQAVDAARWEAWTASLLGDRLEAQSESLSAYEERLSGQAERISEYRSQLAELNETVEEVENDTARGLLQQRIRSHLDTVDALEGEVDDQRETVGALQEETAELDALLADVTFPELANATDGGNGGDAPDGDENVNDENVTIDDVREAQADRTETLVELGSQLEAQNETVERLQQELHQLDAFTADLANGTLPEVEPAEEGATPAAGDNATGATDDVTDNATDNATDNTTDNATEEAAGNASDGGNATGDENATGPGVAATGTQGHGFDIGAAIVALFGLAALYLWRRR